MSPLRTGGVSGACTVAVSFGFPFSSSISCAVSCASDRLSLLAWFTIRWNTPYSVFPSFTASTFGSPSVFSVDTIFTRVTRFAMLTLCLEDTLLFASKW